MSINSFFHRSFTPPRRAFTRGCGALSLALAFGMTTLDAQNVSNSNERLAKDLFKNGDETLRTFEPISRGARSSVVKLDLDGSTVALAAVIGPNGLAVTKSTQLRAGKLTAWLANGREVDAELLASDEESDLALVRIKARGLKAVRWTTNDVAVGQWVVTPGVSVLPQAVGIVSVPPRKILPKRALIGIQLDITSLAPKIAEVMKGFGAEKAGLKAGDQILSVNGEPVKEREQLIKTLRTFREGQTVNVRVQREKEEFEASIEMMVLTAERGERGLDRSERMDRMGSEPSKRAEGFAQVIQHDTVLQAWQCGGPLLNLEGKALGLNIARAGRVASYALPAALVQTVVERLKSQTATKPSTPPASVGGSR